MGCIFLKPEPNCEIVDIEQNNQLMENLKFYNNQNNQNKINKNNTYIYDCSYRGKDEIL